MDDLLYGVSVEELQKITGEDLRVVRQWKKGTRRLSESAIRLVKIFAHGDLVICWETAGMASISGMGCYMFRSGATGSEEMIYAPCSFGASWCSVWRVRSSC